MGCLGLQCVLCSTIRLPYDRAGSVKIHPKLLPLGDPLPGSVLRPYLEGADLVRGIVFLVGEELRPIRYEEANRPGVRLIDVGEIQLVEDTLSDRVPEPALLRDGRANCGLGARSPSRFAARPAGSAPGLLGDECHHALLLFCSYSDLDFQLGLTARAFQNFVNVSTPSAFTATRSQWRMPP
jgi:hypothetical protein